MWTCKSPFLPGLSLKTTEIWNTVNRTFLTDFWRRKMDRGSGWQGSPSRCRGQQWSGPPQDTLSTPLRSEASSSSGHPDVDRVSVRVTWPNQTPADIPVLRTAYLFDPFSLHLLCVANDHESTLMVIDVQSRCVGTVCQCVGKTWRLAVSASYQIDVVCKAHVANRSSADGNGSVVVVKAFTHDLLQDNEQHMWWTDACCRVKEIQLSIDDMFSRPLGILNKFVPPL